MSTLFQQLGGNDAINAAVDIFYDKLLADDCIKHFFDGVDMNNQRAKQRIFLAFAFGGPVNYDGKGMREAHKHLSLNDTHFDAVVEHLVATLQELNVAPELIAQVGAIAESTRDDVLNREPVRSS